MLLPEKHITLAESLIGLGGYVLASLAKPKTVDQLYQHVQEDWENKKFPAFHSYDSVVVAVLFLFTIGLVEATETGAIRRCVS
jgi:hypothetical protein